MNCSPTAWVETPKLITLEHRKKGIIPLGPTNINQMNRLGKLGHSDTKVTPPVSIDALSASSSNCSEGNISLDASLSSSQNEIRCGFSLLYQSI